MISTQTIVDDSASAKPAQFELDAVTASRTGRRTFIKSALSTAAALSLGAMSCSPDYHTRDYAGPWTKKADLPTPRFDLSIGVIDNKLYALGGYDWDGHRTFSSAEVYDANEDRWYMLQDMSYSRRNCGVGVLDKRLYVVGGLGEPRNDKERWGYLSSLEMYEPDSDSWIERRPMPTPRDRIGVAAVDGKLYVAGGFFWSRSTAETYPDGPRTYFKYALKTLEVYDPQTDTWERRKDMPKPSTVSGAAAIDGKLYIVRNASTIKIQTMDGCELNWLSELFVYDPEKDGWTRIGDVPTPRADVAVADVNKELYLIGGSPIPAKVEAYNTQTGMWSDEPSLRFPRSRHAAGVIKDTIYVLGGCFVRPMIPPWRVIVIPSVEAYTVS